MARLLPDVQSYELMIIFLHDLGETEISKKVSELKKLIEDAGGKVIVEDNWGMRDLVYKIKKQDRGIYYVLNFNLEDRAKVNELNKTLLLDNVVVRHLLTKTPADYTLKTFKEYETEAKEIEKLEEKKAEEEEKKTLRKLIVEKAPEKTTEIKEIKEKRAVKKTAEAEKAPEKEVVVEEKMPTVKEASETEAAVPITEKAPKAEAPAAEEAPVAEEKPSKKKPKEELDDLDEKLKKIMENPDITI